MKHITTQKGIRPFISAIIKTGQSRAILRGKTVIVEINGWKYKALWNNEKGLYADLDIQG